MAQKKVARLPRSTPEEIERDDLAKAQQAAVIEELARTRSRLVPGQFGDLDAALGRTSGYLNEVFGGQATLQLHRLFAGLHYMGESPADFFERLHPRESIPSSPIGLLLTYKEAGRRPSIISCREQLLAWADSVEVSEDGKEFPQSPDDLMDLVRRDFDMATRLADAGVGAFIHLSNDTLAKNSVAAVAKWLSVLASIARIKGDRNTSAEIFDVAFRLEGVVTDLACRAFVFRNAAYLLSDFGDLREAERFARKSVDL